MVIYVIMYVQYTVAAVQYRLNERKSKNDIDIVR